MGTDKLLYSNNYGCYKPSNVEAMQPLHKYLKYFKLNCYKVFTTM